MVFQSYALYPHMTVEQNIGFALRMNGVAKALVDDKVKTVAKALKLEAHLRHKPNALSGGQRQCVAIGRPSYESPRCFCLMNRFLTLMLSYVLKCVQKLPAYMQKYNPPSEVQSTMIYVTHDQVEAMTLADKIVVLHAGVIEQVGTLMTLYDDPNNKFVAGFIGSPAMNFINTATLNGEITLFHQQITAPKNAPQKIILGLRPEYLTITTGNELTIDIIEELGNVSYIHATTTDNNKLIIEHKTRNTLRVGDKIGVELCPKYLYFFDPDSEQRLRFN